MRTTDDPRNGSMSTMGGEQRKNDEMAESEQFLRGGRQVGSAVCFGWMPARVW
jgi:hypothetical protein